jgi:hypothetical protein
MDPALIQMLAQQLGLTQEQEAALRSGDVESVMAARDPRLAAMWKWVTQRREQTDGDGDKESEKIVQLQQAVQQLKAALDAADVMLKHVASVFGACPYCWGRNANCRRCHGHGVPGSSEPDPDRLLAWAEPALRKIGMQVTIAHAEMRKDNSSHYA